MYHLQQLFCLIFSRNVPPEFLDGMGSYSMSTSLYHHQDHLKGQNGNSNIQLPAQTIVTSQPRSVQTISSTQLEAKSTVQALVHQPTPPNNHVHPRLVKSGLIMPRMLCIYNGVLTHLQMGVTG